MAIAVFTRIIKRNGRVEDFNPTKISSAIAKAGQITGEFGEEMAQKMTVRVLNIAQQIFSDNPTVEGIQDIVEDVLHFSERSLQSLIRRFSQQHMDAKRICAIHQTCSSAHPSVCFLQHG